MTIVIERVDNSGHSQPQFSKIRKMIFITPFVIIPVTILLFYGVEDNTAWFFGHDYINDYRYRIDGVVYNIGIMVAHFALLVTLSVVGLLIAWIMYETLKATNIIKIARVRDYGKS